MLNSRCYSARERLGGVPWRIAVSGKLCLPQSIAPIIESEGVAELGIEKGSLWILCGRLFKLFSPIAVGQGGSEAEVDHAGVGACFHAGGGAVACTVGGIAEEGSSARHAFRHAGFVGVVAIGWALRIGAGFLVCSQIFVGFGAIPVRAPFPHISDQVVETIGIRLGVDKEGGLARREIPRRRFSKSGRTEGNFCSKFRRASAITYSSAMHSWPRAWISSSSRRMAPADLPAEKRMLASRKTRISYGVARDGCVLNQSANSASAWSNSAIRSSE